MPVDLVKEYIKLNKIVLMTQSQSVFESDIIVPDSKPDIAEVLVVDAFPSIDSVENYKDKLSINFNITYKILYKCAADGNPIKSINVTLPYCTDVNADGLSGDCTSYVTCDVEHVDPNLLNERKLNMKSIIKFNIKVTSVKDSGIACDMDGGDDIQTYKKQVNVSSCNESVRETISLDETLTLPGVKSSISELLRYDAVILSKSAKLNDGNLIIKGEICLTALYIAEDQNSSLQYIEFTLPFTHTADISIDDPDTVFEADILLKNFSLTATEDTDGEMRNLIFNAQVIADIRCFENKSIGVLFDAYCLNSELMLETENFKASEYLGESQNQFVLKEVVKKAANKSEISEIINVACKTGVTDYRIEDSRIVIEGFVKNDILYLSPNPESPIDCFTSEIPFKHVFDYKDADEGMTISVKADVEHINFSMISSEDIELRIVVNACASINRIIDIPIVTNASENALNPELAYNRSSVIIYFVKPGDSLWKIAKKYFTTVDLLCYVNEMTEKDNVYVGQTLLIPKAF